MTRMMFIQIQYNLNSLFRILHALHRKSFSFIVVSLFQECFPKILASRTSAIIEKALQQHASLADILHPNFPLRNKRIWKSLRSRISPARHKNLKVVRWAVKFTAFEKKEYDLASARGPRSSYDLILKTQTWLEKAQICKWRFRALASLQFHQNSRGTQSYIQGLLLQLLTSLAASRPTPELWKTNRIFYCYR